MFKTIKKSTSTEIVEKKSKFIANLFYVETRKEAENIIKQINKKYYDARHNCYAFRILENDEVVEKSSDDGEPSGTAGAPMLNILSKDNFINVLVVVTRYFGGILLGTGGLVKAYSQVTKNALNTSELTDMYVGFKYIVEIKYTSLENFKYFIKNNEINVIKEEYFENVKLDIFVPEDKIKCLKSEKMSEFNIINIEKVGKTCMKKA